MGFWAWALRFLDGMRKIIPKAIIQPSLPQSDFPCAFFSLLLGLSFDIMYVDAQSVKILCSTGGMRQAGKEKYFTAIAVT